MVDAALVKLKNGEIEDAYIIIMKYLNVITYIQKSNDYQKDPKFYRAMLGKKPRELMQLAEELHQKLSDRYENLKFEEESNKENANILNLNKTIEPLDMREKKESKSTMTSANLFNMLRDGVTKVLVMDARSSGDYESSRIKEDTLINIPDEILEKG